MLFSKLFAAAALVSSTFAAPTEEKRASKLKWFGINESGAEFGEKNFTGLYGKEFIWYDLNTIDQFIAQGMNVFRLNFCQSLYITLCNISPTLLIFYLSDGASDTKLAHWRVRPPIPWQLDPANQPHHWQGQVRYDSAPQLRPLLR